jgi:hypothetical protein
MKTIIRLALVTILLAAAFQCFAMMDTRFISPAKAKELGIIVRAQPNGTNEVWVQLEFKAEGELKGFDHVSLEIRDGEKFLFGWSALEAKRSESGSIVVGYFLMNRSLLDKVTLRIVAGEPMNYSGNDLRLKEFVDLKNLDTPPPDKKAGAKLDAPSASPAPPAAAAP